MRVLTRPDMDGIACAVLLKAVEPITEVRFTEPQLMHLGRVEVTGEDIICNLPFDPRCGMWFDHHKSNTPAPDLKFSGRFGLEPSAARVVYQYYEGRPELAPFMELLEVTDRVDAAELTLDDVLNPSGYVLVALTLDPKSGLGRSEVYDHALVEWLVSDTLPQLLERPEVKWRCQRLLQEQAVCVDFLKSHSQQVGKVAILDIRHEDTVPAGNRFLIYTLFPTANCSMRVSRAADMPGYYGVSLGHSIFNRTCSIDVGQVLSRYGGGGHAAAGSSRIKAEDLDRVVAELIEIMRQDT